MYGVRGGRTISESTATPMAIFNLNMVVLNLFTYEDPSI
jgi:hypothetical protein